MFEKELEYFIVNQDRLVKEHLGKVLVIKGKEILGIYDTDLEAYLKTQQEHSLGTFMLQPCKPGPDAYTVKIFSQIYFVPYGLKTICSSHSAMRSISRARARRLRRLWSMSAKPLSFISICNLFLKPFPKPL